MRVFVAIEIDELIRKRLSDVIEELRPLHERVRGIRPENLHITLKFLGEIKEERIEKIKKVLKEIADSTGQFNLMIKGVGQFPENKRPRVIWAGIEDCRELISLQERIEKALSKLGFKKEEREFQGHITLARVKESEGIERLREAISRLGKRDFGDMEVKEFVLMKSELGPEGARYKRLEVFSLKG